MTSRTVSRSPQAAAVPTLLHGPLLGAHVSVAGGMATAFERAEELACRAIQIFVKNANRWQGKPLAGAEVAAFRARREESPIGPVVAHASYLINLGATDETVLARSEAALADELDRCDRLGVDALVLHPGAHLGTGEEAGVERVAAALARVLAGRGGGGTRLLLENTAGQGTVLGWRLEQLAAIRAAFEGAAAGLPAVGFCLDTCHAFAAGYPVHEPSGSEDFLAEADTVLGLDAVGCWHLNDSVKPFGSRVDRHAHIGEGEIGTGLFARLLADRRLAGVPLVIETETGDEMAGHRRDLEVLRALL
ncbi:MAG TPA: deoxyribonuclease IV [Thermoanaerobaculia bacterium]|nr:deoxyribonuclease IV [Thermoanaerobaculia bacterium]